MLTLVQDTVVHSIIEVLSTTDNHLTPKVHTTTTLMMGTQRMVSTLPAPINYYSIVNMSESLKVVSYNCRGFPKTTHKLREKPTINMLLNKENIDIMCLQETFLSTWVPEWCSG